MYYEKNVTTSEKLNLKVYEECKRLTEMLNV